MAGTSILKSRPIRLHGTALKALQNRIYERDGACIICGSYVDPCEKFHHEPTKAQGGQDIEQGGVILCQRCHMERHAGKNSTKIKRLCEDYLKRMYEDE